ncbi:acyl-CoA dehydrogenase family protein [Halorarius litoreus]|uniref:acyl-CoA dehydrogenase family protein n=1 Tax=Halorarius litoreus TaxID=2962676 RepID=UPI0020CC503D|nr:acyl-CoA dehydrogenase family protein [Halorarius litoreus]
MRFTLTEAQRTLRDDARAFAAERIEPVAGDLDRTASYPRGILADLGEKRWTGLTLDEDYGGCGRGYVALSLVTEELAAALMPVAAALNLHLGVAQLIQRFGTDAQRDRWLPAMARFDTVAALGLSEDEAGSDKSRLETTAEREGDEWVLSGHKRWVTNVREADVVLVYAKTGGEWPENVTAFLVDATDLHVDREWDTLGARTVPTCRVTLDDVRVPDDRVVGTVGEGYVERGAVANGINVPARGVGIARAALEAAADHVSTREQHGGPLADKQGVRWTVERMARRVDTARLTTLRAADLADRGEDLSRAMPTAKITATEAAVENANEAMQLLGGIGYTTERPVERYLRDAKLLTIAGGPNEGHRDAHADAVFAGRNP